MLTKAFQEQWATALESGKYKQGTGKLRDHDDNYCCLGVAIDLVCPSDWVRTYPSKNSEWGIIDHGGFIRSGFFTAKVRKIIGLNHDDQEILSAKNDESDADDTPKNNFCMIAEYIRSLPTCD